MDICNDYNNTYTNNNSNNMATTTTRGTFSYKKSEEFSPKEDPGDMTFCMSNYSKEVMKMMLMMRSHQMLTDVILEVQQELFYAHKVVLSAASPYFKAMFTGGLKESEMSRVKLQGVCPTAMGVILYFMYSGHIRVTEVTVCQLLPAATMFQVPNIIDACCAFLERQLDRTNAIGIASFAEQHGCVSLKQKANQFIERHFTQICQEEEFLELSAIQLLQLIRKDELNVQQEREVYDAVIKWIRYDEDNRFPKMQHILGAVRCQFLTPSFLKEQMKNCDVLRKVPACREYLASIFKDLTLHKRSIVRERTPNTTRMIFISGGYFRHSLDILEGFNIDDKTWITLPRLRVPRSGLGAAFLKGTFYAVGGRNNSPGSSYDSDWVDRYNPITEVWRPSAPMSVPRNRVGVAVMDELLYAVGGSAGSEYHNTVEYYDPEDDRWTLVQPMHSKRLGVGVAVVNRLLYAIGGFDGNVRLASIECYHPENNAWTVLPPMTVGRSGAGVAALNQYIYVVGGFDGNRQLASVERFDTEHNVWERVTSIKIARSALSLTVLDGKLYAMGGFDGHNFLAIVEVYCPETNAWEEGTPLTSGRSGHASAVIYQPSCVISSADVLDISSESDNGNKRNLDGGDKDGHPDKNQNNTHSDCGMSSKGAPFTAFSGNNCNNCGNNNNNNNNNNANNNNKQPCKHHKQRWHNDNNRIKCEQTVNSIIDKYLSSNLNNVTDTNVIKSKTARTLVNSNKIYVNSIKFNIPSAASSCHLKAIDNNQIISVAIEEEIADENVDEFLNEDPKKGKRKFCATAENSVQHHHQQSEQPLQPQYQQKQHYSRHRQCSFNDLRLLIKDSIIKLISPNRHHINNKMVSKTISTVPNEKLRYVVSTSY